MSFVASENVTILFKGWKVSSVGGRLLYFVLSITLENKSKIVNLKIWYMILSRSSKLCNFLISGVVGSCIAVLIIAVFFESLKSYKVHRHKACRESSEKTPLIKQPHKIQRRYFICWSKGVIVVFTFSCQMSCSLKNLALDFPIYHVVINQSKS